MSTKISQIDFAAKEVKYHRWCRAEYQTEAKPFFKVKTAKQNDASSTHREIYYEWHKERKPL